jgi:hypothetical protein
MVRMATVIFLISYASTEMTNFVAIAEDIKAKR